MVKEKVNKKKLNEEEKNLGKREKIGKKKTRNNKKERRKVKRYIIKYLIPSHCYQSDMDSNGLG